MKVNIYLSGHMHNNWRRDVEKELQDYDVELLVPLKGDDKEDARFLAVRDKLLIQLADIIFAYIQDSNDYKEARYFGLGLEVGYAAALNKVIILVNELEGKIESFDFAIPFTTAATNTFEEGIRLLRFCIESRNIHS